MAIVDNAKIQYSSSCTPVEEQELQSDAGNYLRSMHSGINDSIGGANEITLASISSYYYSASKSIATSATQLNSNSNVASFVAIQNLDTTNYVTVSLTGNTAANYVIKIPAKGAVVLEGDGTYLGVDEVYAKANTAALNIKYLFGY